MKHLITGLIAVAFLSAGCGGDEKKLASETSKKAETVEQKAEIPSNEPKQEVALRLSSNDQMKYDKSELRVPANSVVTLTLVNEGQMPKSAMGHNFVLLKSGTDVAAFGMKAIEAGIDKDHIPTSNAIIAHTKLIGGGEETTVTFNAPAKGSYDFICSFPGHYALMKGKFIVE
ncbi:MAG TPA: azurin [Flavobacteriales bacterium]|nr:azurin [Flavobacteriales bacterium]